LHRKIRIGAVSYLNTKPMITGLENIVEIDLTLDYPANIAKFLLEDTIDIGLIPVAIIPLLPEYYIITDYGIGCNGKVASVCLFSDVPIHEIKTILLDYQSRTSVQLLKVLLKEYWKKEIKCVAAEENFETQIAGTTAGLVIGDRAFNQKTINKYEYDLGDIWKLHTGLPFVFATWVSNKKIENNFVTNLQQLITDNLENYFENIQHNNLQAFEKDYLQHNIVYQLTEDYKVALNLFLTKME
jgi:chorismate dehydratase